MQFSNMYQLNEEHLRDLAREAEHARLAEYVQANQPKSANLVAELGRQLGQLGQRLQTEYRTPTRLPKSDSHNER